MFEGHLCLFICTPTVSLLIVNHAHIYVTQLQATGGQEPQPLPSHMGSATVIPDKNSDAFSLSFVSFLGV